jgi:urease accessory protein
MKTIANHLGGLLALVASGAALAHPGHSADALSLFAAGFSHPFTGLDHLLAMLAVGLWASQSQGSARWGMPLAFVGTMLAGALLAASGYAMPVASLESLIAASVLVLGLGVAFQVKLHAAMVLPLVAGFALFHGMAHGVELGGDAAGYAPGFVLATAILHGMGLVLGALLGRGRALRAGGLPIALSGLVLLAQSAAA